MKPSRSILSLLSASFSLAIARDDPAAALGAPRAPQVPRRNPVGLGLGREVGRFLQDYLEQRGYTVYAQPVEGGDGDRRNIFAYLGGSNRTRVLVTSHIDTVPPFLPYERRGTELWGRGTVDAKGAVAAQIAAVESLCQTHEIAEEGGDDALLFVVGEEDGSGGMAAANDLGLGWEAVIFGEPTEGKLARGHKGILSVSLAAVGKAGHSGYPEPGTNAIDTLVRGLTGLQSAALPRSDEFGETTLNVGVIQGGVADNVLPAQASAAALVRLATDRVDDTKDVIEKAVHDASPGVQVEFPYSQGPVPIDYDVEGFDTVVLNYGTDIPNLKGNHKCYLYGPGSILVAHSDHEHLDVSVLEVAVEGYRALIGNALKSG
ncbi:Peptidase M20 domain-containing protein [Apiospora hydei]|uniref:Peptidase M20 domain-containing protein n=1 Tax=Apiospora hydei TaxID=1337664 RepID=A0ABR1WPM6_9PEZI